MFLSTSFAEGRKLCIYFRVIIALLKRSSSHSESRTCDPWTEDAKVVLLEAASPNIRHTKRTIQSVLLWLVPHHRGGLARARRVFSPPLEIGIEINYC